MDQKEKIVKLTEFQDTLIQSINASGTSLFNQVIELRQTIENGEDWQDIFEKWHKVTRNKLLEIRKIADQAIIFLEKDLS